MEEPFWYCENSECGVVNPKTRRGCRKCKLKRDIPTQKCVLPFSLSFVEHNTLRRTRRSSETSGKGGKKDWTCPRCDGDNSGANKFCKGCNKSVRPDLWPEQPGNDEDAESFKLSLSLSPLPLPKQETETQHAGRLLPNNHFGIAITANAV